jgi:hypothetical protein
MMRLSNLNLVSGLIALALAIGAPGTASAADKACESLPRSALKTRSCNPQADCLRAIPSQLKGGSRAAREKECSRLPLAGTCYGPDRYDPQSDCRSSRRR